MTILNGLDFSADDIIGLYATVFRGPKILKDFRVLRFYGIRIGKIPVCSQYIYPVAMPQIAPILVQVIHATETFNCVDENRGG
ncbi:MAG: hypothetical protein ACKVHE_27245, partial [Planctomycetales bacterium]